jgi:heme A synthase
MRMMGVDGLDGALLLPNLSLIFGVVVLALLGAPVAAAAAAAVSGDVPSCGVDSFSLSTGRPDGVPMVTVGFSVVEGS